MLEALFKVVIREKGNGVETIAYLIPNIIPKSEKNLDKYLVSVDRIEELTGLDFLRSLSVDEQGEVKSKVPEGGISW